MRQSSQDYFNQVSLEQIAVSQESLLGEMLQTVTNIFYYRPFNEVKMAQAAVDPGRERIRSMYRLERLLKMCFADPRWLAKKEIRSDSIGGQGIVNLLSFGSHFEQDNPLQSIERSLYNINNFRVNWARSTVAHSDYAREHGQRLIDDLEKLCKPVMEGQIKANERAAKHMQAQYERQLKANPGQIRPMQVRPPAVELKEVIREVSRTPAWEQTINQHLKQFSVDNRLRNLGPDRFWSMAPESMDLFGGQQLDTRKFQTYKAPAEFTQVRPLSKDEIRNFAHFILNLIRDKSFTLWADMVNNDSPKGVFISMAGDPYISAVANGRHGSEVSTYIGAKPNMQGWKKGIAVENQIETLVVGMINWMTRSIDGGTRL